MTAQVTIITPTYNKPEHLKECAQAVLAQTYQDWVWWIIFNLEEWDWKYSPVAGFNDPRIVPLWYPIPSAMRMIAHITARVVNWAYPKVQTPYIYFLPDDDLITFYGLAELVSRLDDVDAVYGRCEVVDEQPDGTYKHACWCYNAGDVGAGTGIEPDCLLDSSQILHTKSLWDRATADGWQLTDNIPDAPHADGILLNRLAKFATFHYVPQKIVTHRRTKLSTWHKPQST